MKILNLGPRISKNCDHQKYPFGMWKWTESWGVMIEEEKEKTTVGNWGKYWKGKIDTAWILNQY